MIKPFRIAAALLIIGIVSVALSACGSGGGNTTATQDAESMSAVADETTKPAGATETVTAVTETSETSAESPADSTAQVAADEPANIAGFETALEHDAAFGFFGGDLFSSK